MSAIAQILWDMERTRIPPRLLEDGGTYDLEFEHSPVEGNVRLRVRSLTAGKEWEHHIAWRGQEEKITGDTAALPAGEYWVGVFCERQAWSKPEARDGVDVRIESLRLYAMQN